MGEVIELRPRGRDPHRQGPALCLVCGYEYQAVAPIGVCEFECPNCHAHRAVWNGVMCMNDDYHVYTCNSCAGTYMRIFRHKDGGFVMLCATCGTTHSLDQVFPVQ